MSNTCSNRAGAFTDTGRSTKVHDAGRLLAKGPVSDLKQSDRLVDIEHDDASDVQSQKQRISTKGSTMLGGIVLKQGIIVAFI